MNRLFETSGVSRKRTLNVFKFSISFCFLAAATVYAILRVLFYEITNPVLEELWLICRLCAASFVIAVSISIIILGVELLSAWVSRADQYKFRYRPLRWATAALLLCTFFIYACNGQVLKGVKKNFSTGLTATYNNIEPEDVLLVMNDEVLNHTDIPIGESFILVNKNVKGFKEKNGKVSVGCSLVMTDKSGKKILDAKDLFEGKDVFNKEDMKYLKCTISTGEPMEWEEKYNVVATFWDKYGDGKIVNTLTFRAIDIP